LAPAITVSRYAEVQIGFSRVAYIVARAHHRCATRPFAKTQSVPSSTVAPEVINWTTPCHHRPDRHNQYRLTRRGSPCKQNGSCAAVQTFRKQTFTRLAKPSCAATQTPI